MKNCLEISHYPNSPKSSNPIFRQCIMTDMDTKPQNSSSVNKSFWRKIKALWSHISTWLLEDEYAPDKEAYSSIDKRLTACDESLARALVSYEQKIKKLAEEAGRQYSEGTKNLHKEMAHVITDFRKASTEISNCVSEWIKDGRLAEDKKLLAQELLDFLKQEESENSHSFGQECLDQIKSTAETLEIHIRSLFPSKNQEESYLLDFTNELRDTILNEKDSVSEISQIVGTDSLAHAYASEAQKVKPRLIASFIIILSIAYITANSLIFGLTDTRTWTSFGIKLSLTWPIAFLLILATRRYWEALRHRELYAHKRNTAITYYSFISHAEETGGTDEVLKTKLIDSLVTAISINPADMMKKRGHYRADIAAHRILPKEE